jgi:hypothetical protein
MNEGGDGKPVRLSRHCVERWQKRFRPGLGFEGAEAELGRVIEHGEFVDAPPEWSGLSLPDSRTSYLKLGEDAVLVLFDRGSELLAKTCIPRGSVEPWERRRRQAGKRQRAASQERRRERGGRRPEPYRPPEARYRVRVELRRERSAPAAF